MKIRTGIFGGSFNPIHNGHLAIGKAFLEQAGLDELWFVVSPQNPFKINADLLDDHLRLEMTRLALADDKKCKVSDVEFQLPRPSYMFTTLNFIRQQHPDHEPVLLIGGDNWTRFNHWYRHEEIISNYHICVYPREGETITIPPSCPADAVSIIRAPLLPISSTDIRLRIRHKQSIHGLVPEIVEDYIATKQLYLT